MMLPVHGAVSPYGNTIDLVRNLAKLAPEALLAPNPRGDLALHAAMRHDTCSLEIARTLLERCPEYLRMPGEGGRLPLHYAVSQSFPTLKLVRRVAEPWHESHRIEDGERRGVQPDGIVGGSPPPAGDVSRSD
jgi:Ankyrin repeats (3 copies)